MGASVLTRAPLRAQLAYQAREAATLSDDDRALVRTVRSLLADAGPALSPEALLAALGPSGAAARARGGGVGGGGGVDAAELQAVVRQGLAVVREQGPAARVLLARVVGLLLERVKERLRLSAERSLASSLARQLPPSAGAAGRAGGRRRGRERASDAPVVGA